MHNREKGDIYEAKALEFLKKQGYTLLDKNFRSKYGEIDIIVEKNKLTIFVEVKYRKSNRFGSGIDSVDARKQRRIYLTAMKYIQEKNLKDAEFRFDLISFNREELIWNRNVIWGDNIGF
ncbi:YraN family protein [uncultured Ilyobacter sp.]|uniref:YraN family protein n=1 Tax=uncultured Ilyobacter sp. TaxID=544433 RepID=UPI0029F53EBD|nr:YraN family protein [uncultured Ilyobacter sp.]